MDSSSSAPGPSSSSSAGSTSSATAYNHQTSIGETSSTSWCSFESVPPPPTPFDTSPPVNAFTPLSVLENNSVEDGGEDEGRLFPEDPISSLSLAVGKDEEVSNAFKDAQLPRSKKTSLFRRVSNPEITLSHNNIARGPSADDVPPSNSFVKPKSIHRFFTLSLPKERLKHAVPSASNNHASEDEDNGSPRNNQLAIIDSGKEDETINSPSNSDSATEDAARISSNPLCSNNVPEHTLSDISGPCSSSLVDKVPVSFVGEGGGEKGDDGDPEEEDGDGEGGDRFSTPIGTCNEKDGGTSTTHDSSSTTTSSSSLSDSCDSDELGACALSCKKKELDLRKDGLPTLGEKDEEGVVPMTVDTCEDYWTRLHDIRIHGCILEYTGIGKSIHDNGFAQSNVPLTPLNHYFEITILDPGESCYIAIGLARKDYNMRKNPGWCRGSIAYHADDGKIFIGGGVGTPFGPRCTTNDILGCGIIFPVKYEIRNGRWPFELVEEEEKNGGKVPAKPRLPTRHRRKARAHSSMDNFGEISSESEDDIWWNNRNQVCEDKVKVFFMRNRKLLGIKEVRIPKGGFYPTIGMMSTNERVSVDLHPLTG